MAVIPARRRLRQEDSKFRARLNYIARPWVKLQTNKHLVKEQKKTKTKTNPKLYILKNEQKAKEETIILKGLLTTVRSLQINLSYLAYQGGHLAQTVGVPVQSLKAWNEQRWVCHAGGCSGAAEPII